MTTRPPLDAAALISPHDDRRTFQRFTLTILVFVRLPDTPDISLCDTSTLHDDRLYTFQAVPVRDVSMTGLFFYSPLPYPSGAPLEVCLCLNGKDYVTAAAIKRRVRINNQLCGFGVSFWQSRTSKELRAALASFLLRQAADTH